ncbi:Ran exchange factor Prp20/Pim1 [Penicillium bovifimosum]|uniref:Ran exchange factor Prp20/Pim1 n=1 Tax=Penicillium bovifimosum TaxID=126998 RepID=A0A9W9HCC0_9EURO|nr:Ran exchange factor Prp20/Pim1 [Penicillium bovifimosum]KAJ5143076.1 Ran exchange factor Prp20/Pim1 [Penicillium bovifimosum]
MPPKKSAPKSAKASTESKETAPRVRASTRKVASTKTETSVKETAKSAPKPAAKSAAKTTAKTTAKSTKPAAKPAAKSAAAKPAAKSATKPRKMATTTTKSTTITKKRKADEDEEKPREIKRSRVAKPRQKTPKPKVVINEAPTTKLNVFVCGEGSSGELGLGAAKNVIDVKRPRLNKLLAPDDVGVVQIAVGGMHCLALTHSNRIMSWGVNDQGALGRETAWDGGYKDIDGTSDSDSDDEDSGLNPLESTPGLIPSEYFDETCVFVEVAASDSASFALTDDGQVYGWGTFRSNDGILGFDAENLVQKTPKLITNLKKVKHLICGANHVLALTEEGRVYSWGSGQQNQLGRRIVERNRLNGLLPREFGLPKGIVHIGTGSYHAFAVHASGKVYAWGLNSFGATAIREGAGEDEAAIVHPMPVDSLSGRNISQICGGAHHSVAIAGDGECLVWGRLDGFQSGLKIDTLSDDAVIKDERGRPRILMEPTAIPGLKVKMVAAASDHSLAIDVDGRAWSWGFSATYQTGQGTQDDIEVATVIDNTATRGKKLNWAGAGGQFSVFTEPTTV